MKLRSPFRKWGRWGQWGRYAAPVVLFSALTLGCGSSANDFVLTPGNTVAPVPVAQTGDLLIRLDLVNARAVVGAVTNIQVKLIRNNEVVVDRNFLKSQTGSEQTIVIEDLAVGTYQLELIFLDGDGNALGSFESEVTISAGETTTIDDPAYTALTFLASGTRTVPLEVNSRPQSVTAGDFNKDGVMDLAAAGQDSNEVYVLIGNADGSYQTAIELTGISYAREITSADLDGDENLDLVVANWNSNAVSIFYGNGNGAFEGEVELDIGGNSHSVKAVDINGDTDLDLVIADEGDDEIAVFLGDGARNFTGQPNVDSPRNWTNRVIVANLDGDTNPDMAFLDFETGELFVALGNGDGTFGAVSTFASSAAKPFNLTSGDIDGDGDLDIVLASRNGPTAPVMMNDGSGSFTQNGSVQTGSDIIWVELADVNGDGVLDLLASALEDSSIYTSIGNGDGTFKSNVGAPLQAGLGPFSFIVRDINLDNVLDIVTVNRGNFANLNSQDGGPASLTIFYGE